MVGGITYLTGLSTAPDFTRHVSKYAEIVKEKSILRKLIKASGFIMERSYAGEDEVADLLGAAEKSIFDISQSKSQKSMAAISQVLLSAYEILEELHVSKEVLQVLLLAL